MLEESDTIQAAARSFGHRIVSEQFGLAIDKADASLKPILTQLRQLYLVCNPSTMV